MSASFIYKVENISDTRREREERWAELTSVAIYPGAIQFTLIPRGDHSFDRALVYHSKISQS